MWGWPVLAALAWAAAAHAELPRIENSPMDAEPSDEQLIEFWPQGAAGEAWAFMECRASPTHELTNCRVLSETPRGAGFGAAALKLAPAYRIGATAPDGFPSEGRRVKVRVWFHPPQMITQPDWAHRPSPEEFARFYPVRAVTPGRVKLDCGVQADGTLTGCSIAQDTAPGQGYAEAAMKMAPSFRMKPLVRDGQPVTGARVQIPIQFGNPGRPVEIVQVPSQEQFLSVWPVAMRGRSGQALIRCSLGSGGKLGGCDAVGETPHGSGFGKAALQLASAYRLLPTSHTGDGGVHFVQVPVIFDPDPALADLVTLKVSPMMNTAPWRMAPDAAQVAAAFPPSAAPVLVGMELLLCGVAADGALEGCAVTYEGAAGYGLDRSALDLAKTFRVRVDAADPQALKAARLVLGIAFVNPRYGSAAPTTIEQPKWLDYPGPDALSALFPATAAARSLKTGAAGLTCTAARGGVLADCAVAWETPTAAGFGDAALAAVRQTRINPWTDNGPVDGAGVQVPFQFNAPPAAKP